MHLTVNFNTFVIYWQRIIKVEKVNGLIASRIRFPDHLNFGLTIYKLYWFSIPFSGMEMGSQPEHQIMTSHIEGQHIEDIGTEECVISATDQSDAL